MVIACAPRNVLIRACGKEGGAPRRYAVAERDEIMAIFSRLTDLLKANINDLLDKAEDPEKMVKQLIIDMEEQVDEATRALGQAMASEKTAARQLETAKASVTEWEEKAKMALKAGNEDLARKALESKVNVEKQVVSFETAYNTISAQTAQLRSQVSELKGKLEEARSRQNLIIARSKMADAAEGVARSISSTNTDSAFSKLDKMEKKVSEKEAMAQAYTELNGGSAEDEFAKLEKQSAVDSELERLKAELGK